MGQKRSYQDIVAASDEDLKEYKKTLDDICKNEEDSLNLGGPITSSIAKRFKKTKKFVTIDYHWLGNDLVWFLTPHPKKPWKVDGLRFSLIVAHIMDRSFPRGTKVDIWRPRAGSIPEWSFKAYGVKNHWSFDEDVLDESIEELLVTLNSIV